MTDFDVADAALDAYAGGGGDVPADAKKRKDVPMDWGVINRLTENFYLIYGTSTVYDNETKRIMQLRDLRAIFGDATKFWLQSPNRKMVLSDKVVFDPTFTGHVISDDPSDYFDNVINLFGGLKVKPKAGSCNRILAHVKRLCGGDEALADWVLKWIAYPFQHPGAKMRTSIIMHGEEGTGKNIFWEDVVARLYGDYGIVITQSQIENQFTGWISCKMFAVADEVVSQAEKRHVKGRLKYYVTGGMVSINEKNLPERWEKNHLNFVFLSNEIQPLALDMGDRRYTVIWCDDVPDREYFEDLAHEIENGGLEAFMHHLQTMNLGSFNEHTKPYGNKARADLMSLGRSPTQRFYSDWQDGLLPVPYKACRAADLYRAFCKWAHDNGERYTPTSTFFGREMGRYITKLENVSLYFGAQRKQCNVYDPVPPSAPQSVRAHETRERLESEVVEFAECLSDWGSAA